MDDHAFPGQHTTTTVVTTNTEVITSLRFDAEHLNTIHGKLKIAELVFSFLGFLMVSFSGNLAFYDKVSFYGLIAGIAFWWSLILLILYLIHVIEKFYKVPWLQIELIACCIIAGFFLLASILVFQYIFRSIVILFQIIFGGLATAAYGYDAYMKLLATQNGEIAQGTWSVRKQVAESVESDLRY